MGLRDGDRVEDEEEEASLSFAVGVWAADGWRGIMFSPGSRDEGASMLAREKSGSSKVLGVLVGAMAFYDGSWGYQREMGWDGEWIWQSQCSTIERFECEFSILVFITATKKRPGIYVATRSYSILLSLLGLSHRVVFGAMVGASLGRRINIQQMTQRMVRYIVILRSKETWTCSCASNFNHHQEFTIPFKEQFFRG